MSFGAAQWGQVLALQARVKALEALGLLTITPAGLALIDDASASAQLTTLGVSTFIKTLLDDADAAAARATLGVSAAKATFASVVTTSGTSIDFTGIPAGVTRITLGLKGVSTNNTADIYLQLGDSGGIETAGYLGAGGATVTNGTSAFIVSTGNVAASVFHGVAELVLVDAATFLWAYRGVFGRSNAASVFFGAGTKATSAILDRVRLTTNGGVDTFDAGSANISWEF